MQVNTELLLNKKRGDVLSPEEVSELDALKDYLKELTGPDGADFEPALMHAIIHMWEEGFIEAERGLIVELARAITEECDAQGLESLAEYPLVYKYLPETADCFGPAMLQDLASFFTDGVFVDPDLKLAFKLLKAGADYQISGMLGGFALVNTLIHMDGCRSMLADCYMEGRGTEVDYVRALYYLSMVNRDHLTQVHEADLTGDSFERVFELLKRDADQGKNYPGLYFSLARMYKGGLGIPYDYEKYMECLKKEESPEYQEHCERLMNWKVNTLGNTMNPVREVKKIDDSLKEKDMVAYGFYDHRSILWRVIHTEDDTALLLANDVLESSYVPAKTGFPGNEKPRFKKFLDRRLLDGLPDYEDRLVETSRGYAFLLTAKEVMKYLDTRESRSCNARGQAMMNGYDDYGLEMDEDSLSAPWWLETNMGFSIYAYVNTEGELDQESDSIETIGIRPAILVKLNKTSSKD